MGIADLLNEISDGSTVEKQKPAPDLFLHATHPLNLTPEECVVIEDARTGIEAARTGGFHTVGLGPHERVGDADIILESLAGLKLAASATVIAVGKKQLCGFTPSCLDCRPDGIRNRD